MIDASHPIASLRVRRFEVPSARPLGDAQVFSDRFSLATVEIADADGNCGLGVCAALLETLPPAAWLDGLLRETLWRDLDGASPEGAIHRVTRLRGGHARTPPFALSAAVAWSLWDLAAKRAAQPLWRYLGGTMNRVRAYGSGLCFHLDEHALAERYTRMAAAGIDAFKVKVGHPDVAWDLRRLAIVRDAVGADATLMVDANESWTAAQSVRALAVYADAGHNVYWVEDPVPRSDAVGLARLRGTLGGALVNGGEYLDARGKRALIEAGAVDILNLNDAPGDSLTLAALAADRNVAFTMGNTPVNLGASIAAALPSCERVEQSFLDWEAITADPYPIVDGCFVLPEKPGHGLAIAADAHRYERT